MRVDYDTLPNPGPVEAEQMPPIDLQTVLFRRNYGERNTADIYWRRIHRHFARQALGELRYLTNRPMKAFGPSHYGQCEPLKMCEKCDHATEYCTCGPRPWLAEREIS